MSNTRTDKIHQIVMKSRGTLTFSTIKAFLTWMQCETGHEKEWPSLIQLIIQVVTLKTNPSRVQNWKSLQRCLTLFSSLQNTSDCRCIDLPVIHFTTREKKHISCLHFCKCDTCFGKQGDFEKSCQWHKTKSVNHKSSVWAFHARLPPALH